MLKLKSLLTERQPDAAYVAAKDLQAQVKKFASLHGETVKGLTQGTAVDALEHLYTSINRIVGALNTAVYHSQPGEA